MITRHKTITYVMQCNLLHCSVLYCTVLYCTALYCSVLYCTVRTYLQNSLLCQNEVSAVDYATLHRPYSSFFLLALALSAVRL